MTTLFFQPDLSQRHLLPDDSRHAVKVLRLSRGASIELTDGKGTWMKAAISSASTHQCEFEVVEQRVIPRRNFFIHLAIAPTKNIDRIEWMLEKCVEIGVDQVSFIHCRTSERKVVNMDRMEKIVVSALKQSRQAWKPQLTPMQPLMSFVQAAAGSGKFIAFVDAANPDELKTVAMPQSDYTVLIGPEGDFTKEELDAAISSGFRKIRLGPHRLRTETAGLAAVMTLNLINSH